MRDRHLIAKTLAAAVLVACAYAMVIGVAHPAVTTAPSVGLGNRLFVEHYVYGRSAANVMVGSSLTARLPASDLGPNFTNLALNGEGALTGLAIVAKSPATPRRVYIEINQFGLGSAHDVLDATFAEPGFTLRRHVAALRKTYQPATLFYALLRGRSGTETTDERPVNEVQRARVVTATARPLAQPLSADRLSRVVAEAKADVAALQARSIQPVFYEMPIDAPLRAMAAPVQMRATVHAAFPENRFCWMTVALADPQTMDGLHLVHADAVRAAHLFRQNPGCALTPAR